MNIIRNRDKSILLRLKIHKNICEQLHYLYKTKNADYGDSFAKVRQELGDLAILVRLCDKMERLKTLLLVGEQRVKDEAIDDTLLDIANYAILELVERGADGEF